MSSAAGYQWLIEQYRLNAMPLEQSCRIDSSVRARKEQDRGEGALLLFSPTYRPADTLVEHLQFALRYEGVNLQVLALLFEVTGEKELGEWLKASPTSAYARRACFLYEWITHSKLPLENVVPPKSRYVPVLDVKQQFAAKGLRSDRYKVFDNLPGNRHFCPLVRRTPFLRAMEAKDLRQQTRDIGTLRPGALTPCCCLFVSQGNPILL